MLIPLVMGLLFQLYLDVIINSKLIGSIIYCSDKNIFLLIAPK